MQILLEPRHLHEEILDGVEIMANVLSKIKARFALFGNSGSSASTAPEQAFSRRQLAPAEQNRFVEERQI